MASALINVPAKAKRGDIIEIKTLMSHIMETGYRHTASGEVVPRDIITSFTCRYNGQRFSAPTCFRRSPPIRSSPSSRPRPRAASSSSNGSATRDFPKPRRLRSRSNEICRRHSGCAADAGAAFAAEIPQAERRSGYSFMKPDTKAMQDEDTANPGMLWVLDGEDLWKRKTAPPTRPVPIATTMPAPA